VAAGLLLAYALAGFLLVPALIKSQVTRRARASLDREARLEGTRFNPFTLAASLRGFDLRDRDGTPLVAFDTLVVNLSLASVFRRALVLDEFRLVRPRVVARIMADGQPAVADLFTPDTAGTPPDTAAGPPRLVIHRLAVLEGAFDFVDESRSPRYEERLRDLGLSIEDLSTLPRETGGHLLTAQIPGGAEVRWTGTNTMEPLELRGQFEFKEALLPRLASLTGDQPLRISSGRGEGKLPYEIRQGPRGELTVSIPGASFAATDLVVQPRDRAEDWVRVPRIDFQDVSVQWPARQARLALLRVSGPEIAARRLADGTVDWMNQTAALRDTSGSRQGSAPPWKVTVAQVEVADGAIRVSDESVRPAGVFEATDINVRAGPVGTDSTVPIKLEATAVLGGGTTIKAQGEMVRSPRAGVVEVAAEGLDLRQVNPYFGENPPAQLRGGRASVSGRVTLRAGRPRSEFNGRAMISGFLLADSVGDSLLAWRAMRLERIRYTQEPDLFRVARIAMERPFARIAIARDKTVNLMALSTMVPATDPEKRTPYEIGEITLENARIDFSDESLILPFRTLIDSAHGSIRDVASFGGTPGALELEGRIEEYGLARASGSLNLADPFAATTVRADFLNVSMPSLTPYSAEFAGYAIREGRMDVEVDYRIINRQLDASHKIVMTNLQLGDKVEGGGAPGFLVKLAVSLLKDDEGRINMDVPVSGSVDDPEFGYGKMMWDAVKSILGKVATAPFRFLGNLLGIGGEDAELVDFDPGRSDVIPPEREKLDSLAAELGRKPELLLSVEGRYDSLADVEALREAQLADLISAQRDSMGGKAESDTSTSTMGRILERLYAAQFTREGLDSLKSGFRDRWQGDTARGKAKYDPGPYFSEVRTRLLAAQPVEAGALETLGAARGTAIAAALMDGGRLDSSRVTVTSPAPVKKKKQGSTRVASEMTMDAR
jgi:uncharacterized protein involved in outer membrane biogenesis